MKQIVVTGATGYLGSHIVKELMDQKVAFKALARNRVKLEKMGLKKEQMVLAEVTDRGSLKGALDGMQVVISTVGITRQKDGLSYMDVDYRANMNLLEEAKRADIKKFIYISAINGDQMRHLKIMEAKEKFVDVLKASGLDYCVIRPNGFFSDMKDFLDMGKKGTVYLFGHGNWKLNPIHGTDLAKVILESIEISNRELTIGGPDILTQNEIAEMALKAWERPIKIVHLPDWTRKLMISAMRFFTSQKTYGPFEFFLTLMGQDNVAPRYGVQRLHSFFNGEVDRISANS